MQIKALAAVFLLTAATGACQLNKDSAGPFDGDPNAVAPSGTTQTGATPATTPNTTPGQNGNVAQNNNLAGTPNQTATPALAAGPRFIGRVPPKTQVLSWPGTAVEAQFTGTKGAATFAIVNGTSYVGVSMDDGAPTRVQVQNNVPIAFGPVPSGNHKVRLTKLNESELGSIKFVSLTTDGTINVPKVPERRLEFVGDSITVGYGVEGTRPCTNTSAMENVLKAWSGITGTTLNADTSVIAWSGHGLVRNAVGVGDTSTMPSIYQRYSATDAATSYDFPAASAPQAVIINLGTNDFTYTGGATPRATLDETTFTTNYVAFVRSIRAKYPKAVIVLATSPMLNDTFPTASDAQHTSLMRAITAVQTQLADSNVRLLDIPTMDTTVAACDYHPSAAEQSTMAGMLVTELRAALNW